MCLLDYLIYEFKSHYHSKSVTMRIDLCMLTFIFYTLSQMTMSHSMVCWNILDFIWNSWHKVIRIVGERYGLSYLILKFLYDTVGSCLFECNVITMHVLLYAVSNIWICEPDTMSHVSLVEPPTNASYPLTSDVTDLHFIGCYA